VTWGSNEIDIKLSDLAQYEFDIANFSFLYASATCGNSVLTGSVGTGGDFGSFSAVPIPASVLLVGTGLLGLVGLGWRRRQSS
jgi:hypothetical protein